VNIAALLDALNAREPVLRGLVALAPGEDAPVDALGAPPAGFRWETRGEHVERLRRALRGRQGGAALETP
jgi:hypothetical protein